MCNEVLGEGKHYEESEAGWENGMKSDVNVLLVLRGWKKESLSEQVTLEPRHKRSKVMSRTALFFMDKETSRASQASARPQITLPGTLLNCSVESASLGEMWVLAFPISSQGMQMLVVCGPHSEWAKGCHTVGKSQRQDLNTRCLTPKSLLSIGCMSYG